MKRITYFKHKAGMRPEEKAKLREQLRVLMQERPPYAKVPAFVSSAQFFGKKTLSSAAVFTWMRSARFIPALLAVLLVMSGGVSYAATGTIPGDSLYPVKVKVNERIKTALAFSPAAKARVAVELAEERLKEAEILAVQGKLGIALQKDLTDRFIAKTEAAQTAAAEADARAEGTVAVEVRADLETMLDAHERVLDRLARAYPKRARSIVALAGDVSLRKQTVAKERAQSEEIFAQAGSDVAIKAAALGRSRAAQNKITEVEKFLTLKASSSDSEARTEVASHISQAKDSFAAAQVQLEAGSSSEAFTLFGAAHRAAREAKVLLDVSKKLVGKGQTTISSAANAVSTTSVRATSSVESQVEGPENVQKEIRVETGTRGASEISVPEISF